VSSAQAEESIATKQARNARQMSAATEKADAVMNAGMVADRIAAIVLRME
jgi:hypothetical protein